VLRIVDTTERFFRVAVGVSSIVGYSRRAVADQRHVTLLAPTLNDQLPSLVILYMYACGDDEKKPHLFSKHHPLFCRICAHFVR